jgi:3-oxoadipate enol-lactonase
VSLFHRFDGPADAPVLVLASSLGTTHAMWDGNVADLAHRYRLLRYDHRGHGGSDVPPGPYTVAALADDVVALLDAQGIERADFLGLSLGGAVGQSLARRHPDRVGRLVLCCTAAKFGTPEAWAERARTVREQGLEAIVDAVLARWFTARLRKADPELVARYREQFVATPREGYAACCDALGAWDFRDELASIDVPTLCVAAADDPSTPPPELELLAESIPRAELVVIPDAAHLVNVEQPRRFAEAVLR